MHRIGICCLADMRSSFSSYPSAKFTGNSSGADGNNHQGAPKRLGIMDDPEIVLFLDRHTEVRCPRDDRVAIPSAKIHLLPWHGDVDMAICLVMSASSCPPKIRTVRRFATAAARPANCTALCGTSTVPPPRRSFAPDERVSAVVCNANWTASVHEMLTKLWNKTEFSWWPIPIRDAIARATRWTVP